MPHLGVVERLDYVVEANVIGATAGKLVEFLGKHRIAVYPGLVFPLNTCRIKFVVQVSRKRHRGLVDHRVVDGLNRRNTCIELRVRLELHAVLVFPLGEDVWAVPNVGCRFRPRLTTLGDQIFARRQSAPGRKHRHEPWCRVGQVELNGGVVQRLHTNGVTQLLEVVRRRLLEVGAVVRLGTLDDVPEGGIVTGNRRVEVTLPTVFVVLGGERLAVGVREARLQGERQRLATI